MGRLIRLRVSRLTSCLRYLELGMKSSSSPPFAFFFHLFPSLRSLLLLLSFCIPLVISTNIHTAERSRLLLTPWRDFDSCSEAEESDEDVRRYRFLSQSPASWVFGLVWPQLCSHSIFHLYSFQRKCWLSLIPPCFLVAFQARLFMNTHTSNLNVFVFIKKNKKQVKCCIFTICDLTFLCIFYALK